VQVHRDERPPWPTVEAPIELGAALAAAPADALVIVDCLTVWVGNLFHVSAPPARIRSYDDMNGALAARSGPTVVVSNEVGLGVHPETSLGREYRDELGRLNQRVAGLSSQTLLLVAGRALNLSDPWEHLT
jgi:adenosyl cobinamide kinase/adenosyl cobinamide phosphate guanylyltransferase